MVATTCLPEWPGWEGTYLIALPSSAISVDKHMGQDALPACLFACSKLAPFLGTYLLAPSCQPCLPLVSSLPNVNSIIGAKRQVTTSTLPKGIPRRDILVLLPSRILSTAASSILLNYGQRFTTLSMSFTASDSTHGRWDLDPEWPSHPPASPSSGSQPRLTIQLDITKPLQGPEGPWLYEIAVQAHLNGTCVAKCAAALIKEDEYKPVTRHFFSAMDLQSNALGDLAQLFLWQEGRWQFTLRRLSPDQKKNFRSYFDRHQWETGVNTHSMIRKYCYPFLFLPSLDITDSCKRRRPHFVTFSRLLYSGNIPECIILESVAGN